jgi:predicted small secreted protein
MSVHAVVDWRDFGSEGWGSNPSGRANDFNTLLPPNLIFSPVGSHGHRFLNCVANYIQHSLITLADKSRHSKSNDKNFFSLTALTALACLLLAIGWEVKMKKKRLLLWGLLLAVLASEGCATVRGMGEDIQRLGRAVKRTVSE